MGVLAAKNKLLTFSDPQSVGGQTFRGFPGDASTVAQLWSEVWFAAVSDLIAPVVAISPVSSQALFASTMTPLVSVPGGGLDALSQAATAAFPLLAASIVPNLIATPPPAPFSSVLNGAMAPFLAGTTDPIGPATAFASALQTWLATALWTIPGPPSPLPFQMAP